jgi:hypothetical protein
MTMRIEVLSYFSSTKSIRTFLACSSKAVNPKSSSINRSVFLILFRSLMLLVEREEPLFFRIQIFDSIAGQRYARSIRQKHLVLQLLDTIHTISIIKRHSPWAGQTFKGFVLDEGKSLSAPSARSDRRIEFYGDSMTQGAQVDVPGTGPDLNESIYDNNYNSYAMMVCQFCKRHT